MTKLEKRVNVAAVFLPFVAFIAAIVLLWNSAVSATSLAILAVMYVLTAVGVTVGFHRLLTHRSFQVSKPLEYVFAVLGSMAVQGPVMSWVADHRKHHAHADEEGDPHSPHVGHGDGATGVMRGLWHAHTGWLFSTQGQASARRYAKDLYEDPGMRLINRRFPMLVLLSLALPALAGWAITGTLAGAAGGLLWGGLVRIFLVHHITWSVNSVCHFLGTRRFQTEDHSTNVAWLALPSFGEAWHHNHHAFPRSASHGLRRWERLLDPSALVITLLEKVGLARNVVRIAPERQHQREHQAAPVRAECAPDSLRARRFSPVADPYLLPGGSAPATSQGAASSRRLRGRRGSRESRLCSSPGDSTRPAFAVYGLAVAGLFGVSALYHRGRWRAGCAGRGSSATRSRHDLRPDRRDLYADLRVRPGRRLRPGASCGGVGRRAGSGWDRAAADTRAARTGRGALDRARLGRPAGDAGRG